MRRDTETKMQIWREPNGSYTATWQERNGVRLTVESPTWRRLVNRLREMNFRTDSLFEDEIPDGIGVLERAMR